MSRNRFKDFPPNVQQLVLGFEQQQGSCGHYLDIEEVEIIADYYLEVQDIEGLQAAVRYGEQLFPDDDAILLRKSHLLCIQGNYEKALLILKNLEQRNPNDTDVCYALGTLYSMKEQSAKAIQYYRKASADGFELDMIYGNMGDEYYKLGKYEESLRYYKKSIEKNCHEERSMYNLTNLMNEQGRQEEAQEYFTALLSDHPYSQEAWYCLGCVEYWMGLYEKSIDAFEYALAIDKTLGNAYFGLSDCHRQLGNIPLAVQALRDSLPYTDNKPYVHYCIGHLYTEAGNHHTAMTYLHDVIKEDPADSNAWADLGVCNESLGYSEEAAGCYRRAIDLDPDNDSNWIVLADLYMHNNQCSQACDLLESNVMNACEPLLFNMRLAVCYIQMGRCNRLVRLIQENKEMINDIVNFIRSDYPELLDNPSLVNLRDDER